MIYFLTIYIFLFDSFCDFHWSVQRTYPVAAKSLASMAKPEWLLRSWSMHIILILGASFCDNHLFKSLSPSWYINQYHLSPAVHSMYPWKYCYITHIYETLIWEIHQLQHPHSGNNLLTSSWMSTNLCVSLIRTTARRMNNAIRTRYIISIIWWNKWYENLPDRESFIKI